jgi:hypothetical protein
MLLSGILATQPETSKFGALKRVEIDGKMCVVRVRASPYPYNTALIRLLLNGSCPARQAAAAASKDKNATAKQGATMTGNTKEKAPARRRGKPIEVWGTDDEKAAITEKVAEAGMSDRATFAPSV